MVPPGPDKRPATGDTNGLLAEGCASHVRELADSLPTATVRVPRRVRPRHRAFIPPWQPWPAERTRPLSGAGAGRRSGPRDPPHHRFEMVPGSIGPAGSNPRICRRTTARPQGPGLMSPPCGTRAVRPGTTGRHRAGPWLQGLHQDLRLAGGTTSSSAPWSRIIGHESRSTKWIGDRARYRSAARDTAPPACARTRDSNLWVSRLRERLQVGDAVVARARGEAVVERQRTQRGVAAGAAAADHQSVTVDLPALGQKTGGVDAVRRCRPRPTCRSAVRGTRVRTRCCRRSSRRPRRSPGSSRTGYPGRSGGWADCRAAVAHHDQRRELVGRTGEVLVGRRIEERMSGEPALGRELDRPRRGQVLGRDGDLLAHLQYVDGARQEIEEDHLSGCGCA